MSKYCSWFFASAMVAVPVVSAVAQTYADQVNEVEAQIQLTQKQKQLQDMMGVDPILSKMPKVIAVMSFGKDVRAKLMLGSGVALTYTEGEVINQRMRVVAITPRDVVVAVTPTGAERAAKRGGGKGGAPVLVPLEFLAGAQPSNPMMFPGQPGTVVQSGPIPAGLMQAPPAIQGGSLANWPSATTAPASTQSAAVPASAAQAMPVTAPRAQN